MNILQKIVEWKGMEIEIHKSKNPLSKLQSMPYYHRKCHSLDEHLRHPSSKGIIAEFKRKSPSKGIINDKCIPDKIAKGYAMAGASAISVLTDHKYFGGSLDDLLQVREVVSIPIMRKDFIIDAYQIHEAKAHGADIILLIAAVLTKEKIQKLVTATHDLGMEVLLEIHHEEEIEKYVDGIKNVGINNRNLKTFEVDFDHAAKLCRCLPTKVNKIAESGIRSSEDVFYLREKGFCGFLIGETFMKEKDPVEACASFINQIKKT